MLNLTGDSDAMQQEEEGSRKRARTGEATLPIMQHLAPQYPQQPPQLQRYESE